MHNSNKKSRDKSTISQKKSVLILLGFTIVLLSVSISGYSNPIQGISLKTQYSPESSAQMIELDQIYINPSIANQGWENCEFISGKGTQRSPYILENLIIDGDGTRIPIQIEKTEGEYLVIKNCIIKGSELGLNDPGLHLNLADNVRFEDCTFENNSKAAAIEYSNHIVFTNCTFSDNSYMGLQFTSVKDMRVIDCTFRNNSDYGLHFVRSNFFVIRHSDFSFSKTGILTDNSPYGAVTYNRIYNCSEVGFFGGNSYNYTIKYNDVQWNKLGIKIIYTSAKNSVIYHNNFMNNTQRQGEDISIGHNFWDNSQISEGNYWGDYQIRYPDATNDGDVWDTPYMLYETKSEEQDHFPLVNPVLIEYNADFEDPDEDFSGFPDFPTIKSSIPGFSALFPMAFAIVALISVQIRSRSK